MKYLKTFEYLKLYESFIQLLKEGVEGKTFILLSGPSASGKTYLSKQKGIVHWYENTKADKVLIGTDNFGGDEKIFEIFRKLLSDNGFFQLSKFKKDFTWLIETDYKKYFDEWKESASEDEKQKYAELKSKVPYSVEKTTNNGYQDGRVCGMAWAAYLLKSKTIVFDDVKSTIKKYFPGLTEILIYTPLDHYFKNIDSRVNSENKAEHIDVNDKDSAIYQYCRWFQATDKPDLDNKMYTAENVERMLIDAKHKNPREILDLLGVKGELENGFYLTTKPGINPKKVINSRDTSTGRAKDASELVF